MQFWRIELLWDLNGYAGFNVNAEIIGFPLFWQLIALLKATIWYFIIWAYKILSLWTILMEISSHNLFTNIGFGGPNIYLVRIQLSLL